MLEQDIDAFEAVLESFKDDLKAIKTLLMGVLVAAVTASIVGSINLILGKFG